MLAGTATGANPDGDHRVDHSPYMDSSAGAATAFDAFRDDHLALGREQFQQNRHTNMVVIACRTHQWCDE